MRTSNPSLLFFIFYLALILCFSSLATAADQKMVTGDLKGMKMVAYKHKHRHSGFSASECPDACQFRCSRTAYKKPCLFYCQKCCFKCRCVPPGTYAHKEVCPCYNNWKTQGGGPKCP